MKQSASQKRGAWFWVGVTLLSLSALLWLVSLPEGIGDFVEDHDVANFISGLVVLLCLTAIPIGIGIYGVWSGVEKRDEIVIKGPMVWIMLSIFLALPLGILFIFIGLDLVGLIGWNLADKNLGGGLGLLFVGFFSFLVGLWSIGLTTRVTFNQPPEYITITHGHIPVFLWFLRTKRISREESRSTFISSPSKVYPDGAFSPRVTVVMKSGKRLKLWSCHQHDAETLTQRILEFGQQ